MNCTRIDHVSIAVSDYNRALDFFRKIGALVPGASATDPVMKYRWQIFSAGDLSRLELLTPTDEGSFLDTFLKDRPGGVHHITFETPDIRETRKKLEEFQIPYFGFQDTNPAWKELFIHPKHAFGVLIQIAQFRPHEWLHPSVGLGKEKRWEVKKEKDGGVLSLAHPGGGRVDIRLSRAEAEKLIRDLKEIL